MRGGMALVVRIGISARPQDLLNPTVTNPLLTKQLALAVGLDAGD